MLDATSEQRLADRLSTLRRAAGWSLDDLAARSGISRGTLSRIERCETSPTAALLGRLCTAHGLTMSRLLAELETDPPSLLRAHEQPVWIDPATGFRRRSLSPPAPGFVGELLEGSLPAGAVIAYGAPPVAGLEHHLWLLEGVLELQLGEDTHLLGAGDVLRYRLFGPSRFHVPGPAPARYALAMCRP